MTELRNLAVKARFALQHTSVRVRTVQLAFDPASRILLSHSDIQPQNFDPSRPSQKRLRQLLAEIPRLRMMATKASLSCSQASNASRPYSTTKVSAGVPGLPGLCNCCSREVAPCCRNTLWHGDAQHTIFTRIFFVSFLQKGLGL